MQHQYVRLSHGRLVAQRQSACQNATGFTESSTAWCACVCKSACRCAFAEDRQTFQREKEELLKRLKQDPEKECLYREHQRWVSLIAATEQELQSTVYLSQPVVNCFFFFSKICARLTEEIRSSCGSSWTLPPPPSQNRFPKLTNALTQNTSHFASSCIYILYGSFSWYHTTASTFQNECFFIRLLFLPFLIAPDIKSRLITSKESKNAFSKCKTKHTHTWTGTQNGKWVSITSSLWGDMICDFRFGQ